MSQLELFASQRRAPAPGREPYAPYDATKATRIILERLKNAGGKWVRRMALRRATGMCPCDVASAFSALERDGIIEFTASMQIIHPAHGLMGQTRGYRICLPMQVAA